MSKKVLVFLLALAVGFTFFGCAKVADTTTSGGGGGGGAGGTGTLPSGTTQCKLAVSNIQASGSGMSFALSALNQNNAVIAGLGGGNFTGAAIYGANPSISSVTASTTLTAVATLTFTAVSGGGGAGGSKEVSAALVIDKSGSMWSDKVVTAEIAGKMFVDQLALGSANNKAAVVLFDDTVRTESILRNATTDKQILYNAITKEAGYGGSTALYYATANGIWEASKEAASTSRVRAVVAMTDGGENASPSPYNGIATGTVEVVNQAVKYSIPVYTVGLFNTTAEALSYGPYLRSIARGSTGSDDNYFEVIIGVTGLSVKRARALGVLADLYAKLAGALSQSYSMTATLSSSLSAGQTYYLMLTFTAQVTGGSTITQTVVVAFVAQ